MMSCELGRCGGVGVVDGGGVCAWTVLRYARFGLASNIMPFLTRHMGSIKRSPLSKEEPQFRAAVLGKSPIMVNTWVGGRSTVVRRDISHTPHMASPIEVCLS